MNKQTNQLTEPISPVVPIKETNLQPESKPEIPPAPTIEAKPDSQPVETLAKEVPAPFETAETAADNLLINPLEPVIKEESPPLHDPATVARLHRDVQTMINNDQFAGAEQEVIHERIQNTGKISLS